MKKLILCVLLFWGATASAQMIMNSDFVIAAQKSADGKQYKIVSGKHVPYDSPIEFLTLIPNTRRHVGQIAYVGTKVYHFVGGITNSDFILFADTTDFVRDGDSLRLNGQAVYAPIGGSGGITEGQLTDSLNGVTLQRVTDQGNMTSNNIVILTNYSEPDAETNFGGVVVVAPDGNSGIEVSVSTDSSNTSRIAFIKDLSGLLTGELKADYILSSQTWQLPDKSGTIALEIDSTVTLTSGTITVSDTRVRTGAKIFVSVNTPSGTQGFLSAPTSSIVDGVSFVINSTSATENSTINYTIINP